MSAVPANAPPAPPASFFRRHLLPLVVVVLALLAFRWSVLDWNVVPTGSMKPTILEGDYIVVNKLAYDFRLPFTGWPVVRLGEPARGDIVVFDPPGETSRYVKRIVGVPGDVLEMRDNRLFVNGQPASYHEAEPRRSPGLAGWLGVEMVAGRAHAVLLAAEESARASFAPVRVPAGHYFVLGDNRDDSKDSRYFGFVARGRIVGRVPSVAVSLDRDSQAVRWDRVLHALA